MKPSTGPSRTQRLIGWLTTHPWTTLGLTVAMTVPLAGWGSGIPIHGDMEDLFPEDAPNVVRARMARDILGHRSELRVLIASPDAAQNRARVHELAETLERESEVIDRVVWQRDISFFERQALLFLKLDEVREMADAVSEVIKSAVRAEFAFDDEGWDEEEDEGDGAAEKSRLPSEDEIRQRFGVHQAGERFETRAGDVVALKLYPSVAPTDTDGTRRLMEIIEGAIHATRQEHPDHDFEVAYQGDYAHVTETVDQIRLETAITTGSALAAIALILALWFRRISAVLLVLGPLLIGLGWTLFAARAFVGYLNVITAFIFAILLGLGIDFAVHSVSRIHEEIRGGKHPAKAIPDALTRLGPAMTAAVMTTVGTFASLAFFQFRGFSQFGLLASMGILLCFSAVYLVLPPLYRITGRRGEGAAQPTEAPPAVRLGRRPVLGVVLIVALCAATALSGQFIGELTLTSDTRMLKTKRAQQPPEMTKRYNAESGDRHVSPALVLTGGLEASERVHRHLEAQAPASQILDHVVSVFTFVPRDQTEKLALIREMKRKVQNKYGVLEGAAKKDADRLLPYLDAHAFDVRDLPDWVKESFTDTRGRLGTFVLLYAKGSKSSAQSVARIRGEIGEVVVPGPNGATTYPTAASWYIMADAHATVVAEGPRAVGLSCLVVFLLLALHLRRVSDVLMAFLPLAMGFVILLGLLHTTGLGLNLFNVVVLPTVFGVGVDTTIHLVHRLREEGGALVPTLRTTGVASGLSALTTSIGFLSLALASNEGLRSIGWTAVLGVSIIFIVSIGVITTCSFMGWFRPWTGADHAR